jgi:uncharacterized SAM-binding protein YcdF (DUF218 family)
LIAERGWLRILLVTDAYHLPRSLYSFHRFGLPADGEAVPPPQWDARLLVAYAREAAAFVVYLWRLERALRAGSGS